MIINQLNEIHEERKEVILPNDVVDSCRTRSIREEYDQAIINKSPPVHPCLKTGEDEQQIVPIGGEGQE